MVLSLKGVLGPLRSRFSESVLRVFVVEESVLIEPSHLSLPVLAVLADGTVSEVDFLVTPLARYQGLLQLEVSDLDEFVFNGHTGFFLFRENWAGLSVYLVDHVAFDQQVLDGVEPLQLVC